LWHPCHILSIELWWPICKYSLFAVDRKYQNGQSRNNYIFPQFNLRYKRQWINVIFLRDQRSLLSQFLNVMHIFIWRHCTRIRIIDIVTQSVVCYCYCEHTYAFIYLYVLIRSAQTNIKHLSNKQQTLIWEVPLASIKCIILFWYKNEIVTQELDTVHLDASSHQSIGRRMKTSVTTESKNKKKN
jgi:hypothetical protein